MTDLVVELVIEGGAKDDNKDGVGDRAECEEQELEQDAQVDGESS